MIPKVLVALGWALAATACGPGPRLGPSGEARAPRAPLDTAADPPYYAAPSQANPGAMRDARRPIGLIIASSHDEARTTAARTLRALIEDDARTIAELISSELFVLSASIRAGTVPRERMLSPWRRALADANLPPGTRADELFDLGGMRTSTVGERADDDLPAALRATDIIVEIDVAPAAQDLTFRIFGLSRARVVLVVRDGAVVGF